MTMAPKDATDHPELLVTNSGSVPLAGLAICYSITDGDTSRIECTFRKLGGISVPAGGEARFHFDDRATPGHFRASPNSICINSQAVKTITFVLKADSFTSVSVDVAKDKCCTEAADEMPGRTSSRCMMRKLRQPGSGAGGFPRPKATGRRLTAPSRLPRTKTPPRLIR